MPIVVIEQEYFSGGRNIAEDPDAKRELADLIIELQTAVNALALTAPLHAGTHVTGGTDVIADAVSGGAAGLLSGADKAALDSVATLDVLIAHGDLLFEGAAGPQALAAGAAGDVLQSGGPAADPSWLTPGTMILEDAADFLAAALLTAQGDLLVGGAGAVPTALPLGTPGQVLSIPAVPGTDPAWDDAGNAAFVATEAVPGTIWAAPPGPPATIQDAIDRMAAQLAAVGLVPIP